MSMHAAFAENHPTGHQQKWQNSALQLSLVWTHKHVQWEFLRSCLRSICLHQSTTGLCSTLSSFVCIFDCWLAMPWGAVWVGICVSQKKRRRIHVPLCCVPLLFICSNGCVSIYSPFNLLPPVSFYCLNLLSHPDHLSINLPWEPLLSPWPTIIFSYSEAPTYLGVSPLHSPPPFLCSLLSLGLGDLFLFISPPIISANLCFALQEAWM